MSAVSVKRAIQAALSNGRVNQREFRKIAREAERDGVVSKSEEKAIRRLANDHYDNFTRGAQNESDSFFCRNDLPLAPTRMTTYGPAGEEDGFGCGPIGNGGSGPAATQAVGGES